MQKKLKRQIRKTRYIIYKETFIDKREHFWSFIGAFVGICLIALIQTFQVSYMENVFLIGSFGASSVLIFGAIDSPLAQPRNLIGGHVISAIIGVVIGKIFPEMLVISAPLAVASSIILMQITKTLHPPGGATALLAVSDQGTIATLGFGYVLSPVLSGSIILLGTALLFNNITRHRQYPKQFNKYPIISYLIFWKK